MFIDNNDIGLIPSEIGLVTNLEFLSFSELKNSVYGDYWTIGFSLRIFLTPITAFFLGNNTIASIPKEIGLITGLGFVLLGRFIG